MTSRNPNKLISDVIRIAESDQRSEIRLNANGGNSILVVCDPEEELLFIESISELMDGSKFSIVDLNKLLLDLVGEKRNELDQLFDLLGGSVNQIFKPPSNEATDDFFSKIMNALGSVLADSKVPVLINTGVLYGAGIDNIQIIEHDVVMRASLPTVILYPATHDGERLKFLGQRPASRYRCMIIP